MAYLKYLPLLLLVGCSPSLNAAIDAGEAAASQKVDTTIARGIDRVCKGPIDITLRTAEAYPGLIPFMIQSCPETYGRLKLMFDAQ